MKTLLILALVILSSVAFAQSTSHFADGQSKMVLDQSYAKGVDWKSIFTDYEQKVVGLPVGDYRKIVVAPDGSIFMSHKTRHEIWKFSPDGIKVKTFGQHGGKENQFPMIPYVQGILDGKYLYTYDVQGHIKLFTLDGEFYKAFNLDYMPMASAQLANGKIAFLGHVAYGKGSVKNIISLYDTKTNKAQIIWSRMDSELQKDRKEIVINMGDKGMMSYSPPLVHSSHFRPRIAASADGKLLVITPTDSKLKIFNSEGQLEKTVQLKVQLSKLSEKDIEECHNKVEEGAKAFEEKVNKNPKFTDAEKKDYIAQYRAGVAKTKEPGYFPEYFPAFSEFLVDDKGMLLLVDFSKEENSNRFNVYSFNGEGEHVGNSELICDDYNVLMDNDFMQFYKGKIIAVVRDKKDVKMPLRLLKFSLE